MSRRLHVVLVTVLAVISVGAIAGVAWQPGTTSGLLIGALVAATIAMATRHTLARTAASSRPVRAEITRDAWLQATIAQSPAHTDVRALMRARPPSTTR